MAENRDSVSMNGARIWVAIALASWLAAGTIQTLGAEVRERGALWSVVSSCVLLRSTLGTSFPCEEVSPATKSDSGFVVLKSPRYPSEFLVTPAEHVVGLESAEATGPRFLGIWQEGWTQRDRVAKVLGHSLARTEVGLAVNSAGTRTQDQFHVHVDCVSKAVQSVLAKYETPADAQWVRLTGRLSGAHFWIKWQPGEALEGIDLVGDLKKSFPIPLSLKRTSVAAIGGVNGGEPGFYILVNVDDLPAEALLDHACGR